MFLGNYHIFSIKYRIPQQEYVILRGSALILAGRDYKMNNPIQKCAGLTQGLLPLGACDFVGNGSECTTPEGTT